MKKIILLTSVIFIILFSIKAEAKVYKFNVTTEFVNLTIFNCTGMVGAGEYDWCVNNSYFQLGFKDNLTDNNPIVFNRGDYFIRYEPYALYFENESRRQLISYAKSVSPTIEGNTITYYDAFGTNIDLLYRINLEGLKEQIVAVTNESIPELALTGNVTVNVAFKFSFSPALKAWLKDHDWDELTLKEIKDKIEFKDLDNLLFWVEKPYAADASGRRIDSTYRLYKNDTDLFIVIKTPIIFQGYPIQFPVYIDPSTTYNYTAAQRSAYGHYAKYQISSSLPASCEAFANSATDANYNQTNLSDYVFWSYSSGSCSDGGSEMKCFAFNISEDVADIYELKYAWQGQAGDNSGCGDVIGPSITFRIRNTTGNSWEIYSSSYPHLRTWRNTTRTNASDYVNVSGSDKWVYIAVSHTPGGAPVSCPYIYSWNGEDYVFEAEGITAFGSIAETEDYQYTKLPSLKQEGTKYKIKITEETAETSYLDKAELLLIKHPEDVKVYRGFKPDVLSSQLPAPFWLIEILKRLNQLTGNSFYFDFYTIKNPIKPIEAIENGEDVSYLLEKDEIYWNDDVGPVSIEDLNNDGLRDSTDPNKIYRYLELTYPKPNVDKAKLLIRLKEGTFLSWGSSIVVPRAKELGIYDTTELMNYVLRELGFRIEIWNGEEWVNKISISDYPLKKGEDIVIPLDLSNIDTKDLKIRFEAGSIIAQLDYAWIDYSEDEPITIERIPLTKADNLLNYWKLLFSDNNKFVLDYGESIELEFDRGAEDSSLMSKTFFLNLKGWYEPHPLKNKYYYELDRETLKKIFNEPTYSARYWLPRWLEYESECHGTLYTDYVEVFVKTNAPKYWDNQTNSTLAGEPVLFSLNWTDVEGLSGYIFSFKNKTEEGGYFGSGTGIFGGDAWNLHASNFTISESVTAYQLRFYINNYKQFKAAIYNSSLYLLAQTEIINGGSGAWYTANITNVSVGEGVYAPGATILLTPGEYYLAVWENFTQLDFSWTTDYGIKKALTFGDGNFPSQLTGYTEDTEVPAILANYTYWINDTWTNDGGSFTGTEAWSNVTKVVNETIGTTIGWRVYANDTENFWNASQVYSFVALYDTPSYSNNQTNTTEYGQPCNFTLDWIDNVQLSEYIFSTNNSGTWENSSLISFSGTSNTSWNVTTLNDTVGTVVAWCFYANDTSGNMNATNCEPENQFILTATDIEPPKYWNNSTNDTSAGAPVLFSLNWTDDVGLSGYIFYFLNGTGNPNSFGHTKKGASGDGYSSGIIRGSWYTPTESGTADSITLYIDSASSRKFKCALYEYDDDGTAGAFIDETEERTLSGQGWETFDFTSGPLLWANTNYYILCWVDGGSSVIWWCDSTSPTNKGIYLMQTYGDWPDTLTGETLLTTNYSIFSNYTVWINDTWTNDSDSFTGTQAWSNVTKVVNETVGSTIKWFVGANDTSDNWNASEIFSFITIGLRNISISEPFTISQTTSRPISLTRILTETPTINEAINRIRTVLTAVYQFFSLNTISSRLLDIFRTISQPLTTNLVSSRLTSIYRLLSQSLTTNIITSSIKNILISISDTFTISSTITRGLSYIRSITSYFTISTTTSRIQFLIKSLSQYISLNTISSRLSTTFRSITSYFTISQVLSRFSLTYISISESFIINQLSLRIQSLTRLFTQQISLMTTTGIGSFNQRITSLSITISESPSRLLSLYRFLSQSITTSLFTLRIQSLTKYISQTISISSVSNRFNFFLKSLTTGFSITDSFNRTLLLTRTFTESLNVNIYVNRVILIIRIVYQTFSISSIVSWLQQLICSLLTPFGESVCTSRGCNYCSGVCQEDSCPTPTPSAPPGGGITPPIKKKVVLDTFVTIETEEVLPGDKVYAFITVQKIEGPSGATNINLSYWITDPYGIVVGSKATVVGVETTRRDIYFLTIPTDSLIGTYTFEVLAQYDDSTDTASATFEVKEELPPPLINIKTIEVTPLSFVNQESTIKLTLENVGENPLDVTINLYLPEDFDPRNITSQETVQSYSEKTLEFNFIPYITGSFSGFVSVEYDDRKIMQDFPIIVQSKELPEPFLQYWWLIVIVIAGIIIVYIIYKHKRKIEYYYYVYRKEDMKK